MANDLTNDEISIDTYLGGSNEIVTPFFCYFYRLIELRPTKDQILIMMRANNVNVRCLALLYLRVYADTNDIYAWMSHSFEDYKMISV